MWKKVLFLFKEYEATRRLYYYCFPWCEKRCCSCLKNMKTTCLWTELIFLPFQKGVKHWEAADIFWRWLGLSCLRGLNLIRDRNILLSTQRDADFNWFAAVGKLKKLLEIQFRKHILFIIFSLSVTVPGILQARTLKWAAISFSRAWKWKVKVKSLSNS